ncbi:hypothetical protein AB1L30_19860 [Bremerella sp. JC817]|uniref:hypothetical protein n=1 Tax=Bremerella sp. JC817 TaxID=3231756 RepID=UPI00345947FA
MTMTREHWLGYLMGALDEHEQASVERQIASDPRAAAEIAQLRSHLHLMADGLDEAAPPAGLASRTCALLDNPGLFAEILDPAVPESPTAPERPNRAAFESLGGGGRPTFTLMDMVVAVGACIAAVAIFFPALASSRMLAARLQCENNLRQVGMALHEFATGNAEKRYPAIAANGPLSIAGSYAPRLIDNGIIRHPETVRCAEMNRPGIDQELPTVEQLLNAPADDVERLQKRLAAVYSYNLGNLENGKLQAPLMKGSARYPVASDVVIVKDGQITPQAHEDGRFNILFDDGHVEFISLEDLPGSMKDYFFNDKGEVAAGLDEDDAVIANGIAHPLIEDNLPMAP